MTSATGSSTRSRAGSASGCSSSWRSSLAWSAQGAEWLEQLEFLPPIAVWAVLLGALLGILRPSIVISLPLGAVAGTAIVLWAIGGEYFPDLTQLDRLLALRAEVIEWLRVLVRTGYPPQMAPYAIGLGVLMFATAFTAAHTLYRYHKVLDAIVLLGAAIVINMSPIQTDLNPYLALFVIAALLLWLRGTLADRQNGWQRRRVSETLEVPGAIMRSGVIFAGASVVLAWLLMSVAVASPLTGVWRNLDTAWITVRDELEGVFGSLSNPNSRISGNSFGPSFTVSGEWVSSNEEALVLTSDRPLYLRTATYDEYTGLGFRWSDGGRDKRSVESGDFLFAGQTSELPTIEESVVGARIAIEMRQTIGNDLFTAGSPVVIRAPSVVVQTNGAPVVAGIEHPTPLSTGEAYELEIALSRATQAELGAAGREYPDEVSELYLDTSGITDRVAQLAEEVIEAAGADNDYERAEALADYLRLDESFTYATKAEMPGNDQDFVDFFLFDPRANRTGYCEYYATAMAVMARSVGLPARVAVGFAPGRAPRGRDLPLSRVERPRLGRDLLPRLWLADLRGHAHHPRRLPRQRGSNRSWRRRSGRPSTPSIWDRILEEGPGSVPTTSLGEVAGAPTDTEDESGPSGPGNALLITGLLLAAAVAITLRMRHTRRKWRLLPAGDRAWRQLTAAAERAGIGQRPSETIYEYAGWLEEQLPSHGEPIHVVADGKVWQSYSGRRLTATSNLKLDAALRALRLPMLSLTAKHFMRRLFRPDSKD